MKGVVDGPGHAQPRPTPTNETGGDPATNSIALPLLITADQRRGAVEIVMMKSGLAEWWPDLLVS
jgi:hypothetical protein